MAAREVIKVNKAMKIIIFESSIKLDICPGVVYNANYKYAYDPILIDGLKDMCKAAYEAGVRDAKDDITEAWETFQHKLNGGL